MTYAYKLDPIDKQILAKLERKPYRKYQLHQIFVPSQSIKTMSERESIVEDLETRLIRLRDLGLVKEETFYMSTKAHL
jgi:hypothetical protein